MGFDLTWKDDPHIEEREAVAEAVRAALGESPDPDGLERHMSVFYRAIEAVGGYYHASSAGMASLVAEMNEQGAFDGNEAMKEKLSHNGGDLVTPDEIRHALDALKATPTSERPLIASAFDREMAKVMLEMGARSRSGVEGVAAMQPLGWLREWVRWLIFLFEAEEHGGIVVE